MIQWLQLPPCRPATVGARHAAPVPRVVEQQTVARLSIGHQPRDALPGARGPRGKRGREAREGSWVRNVDEMMKQDETSAIISFLYTRHLSWWRQSWHRTSFTYSFNWLKQVDSWWIQLNTSIVRWEKVNQRATGEGPFLLFRWGAGRESEIWTGVQLFKQQKRGI